MRQEKKKLQIFRYLSFAYIYFLGMLVNVTY